MRRSVPSLAWLATCLQTVEALSFDSLSTMFVFGDSYSRTGFDPTSTQPSPSYALGNPAYPGRTSANGPNWVDLLTTKYNSTLFLTYNFGTSGATVNTSIVESGLDFVTEIQDLFLPYYSGENATWDAATTLFALWFGINDVHNSYLLQDETINPAVISSYRWLIDDLYKVGARNFLILNVPPLQRAPRITQSSAADERVPLIGNATADYNKRLLWLQEHIEYAYEDATVRYFNTNALFNEVIDGPGAFEQTERLRDTVTYCSAYQNGTPEIDTKYDECEYAADEYFWINNLHPTSPMHEVLVAELASFLSSE